MQPNKTLKIIIQGNEEIISFPKMGQLIDIEANKQAFASKQYRQLLMAGTVTANLALDLVDTFATFSVLIPDFTKRLKIESIFDLDLITANEVVREYTTKFVPWYNEWMLLLQGPIVEVTKEDKEEGE